MTVDVSRREVQVTQLAETGEREIQRVPPPHGIPHAPMFTVPLRSVSVPQEGSPARLQCSISAEPPATITWFLEGEVLHDPDLYYFASSRLSNTHSLLIREVFSEDTGSYECQATNPHGIASSTARLTLENQPKGVCV